MDEIDLFIIRNIEAEMAIEDGAHELVKDYSNDFIEFIINKDIKKKKPNNK